MSELVWGGAITATNAEFVSLKLEELLKSRKFAVVRSFTKFGQAKVTTGYDLNNPPYVERFEEGQTDRFELILRTSLGDLEYSHDGTAEAPTASIFNDHALVYFTDSDGRRVCHMLIPTG